MPVTPGPTFYVDLIVNFVAGCKLMEWDQSNGSTHAAFAVKA